MESFAEESHCSLLKVGPFLSKDGPMAAVRKYPELRLRYRSRHFNGQFDRIERIAVALHDERSSLDRREIRRSEVHIVITGGKRFRALEESPEPADHHPNDGGEEIPVAPREGCPHTDA